MEIVEFNKVLSKSLDIVEIGIKKGYFDIDRKEELNNKLISIFKNGIVYDLPGTAVYGMYSPREKRLYFNAKVFKSEEEALVYILHEIKHGLDHYDVSIGFEYEDKGVGINEGATQRFATDMAEEILKMKFPKNIQSSLGIQFNTHLDEYQIEDKLNELFCITIGISMEEFIRMQNNPQKKEFQKVIDKFNQYASFDIFKNSLDEIYMIQEETWFDENHNLLDEEKKPTPAQTTRAMTLISRCKQELLKYAKKANLSAIDIIKEESFMAINEYGEIIRDNYDEVETINQTNSNFDETMTEENIVAQADYVNYHQNILNQIGSNPLNNECSIIFVTEFRYEHEKCDKIIYFRKGDSYQKMIIPMRDDMTLDITNISIQKVDDINEIKISIEDCEAEFGVIANAPEYANILNIVGESNKAQSILNKWNYYLSKQGELEQIRQRVEEQHIAFNDEMARIRASLDDENVSTQQSYFDNLFSKEIMYGNIFMSEDGISIINPNGTIKFVSPDEEQQYISQIQNALEKGEISLNRVQLNLLDSYSNDSSPKKK